MSPRIPPQIIDGVECAGCSAHQEYHHQHVEITVFDDGNQKNINYANRWSVIGREGGKVQLRNTNEPEVILDSISGWKTRAVDELNCVCRRCVDIRQRKERDGRFEVMRNRINP